MQQAAEANPQTIQVLEDPTEAANMAEVTAYNYNAKYDPEKWTFDDQLGLFSIYDKAVFESGNPDGNCANINVVISQEYGGPITQDDLDSFMAEMESNGIAGLTIEKSELREFNGDPVMYYESKVELTDEMLDMLVDNGNVTEAQLTDMGGRDFLKESGKSNQIGIIAIVDGKLVIFTGTYFEKPDELLEAMKILIKTGKVS